MRFPIHIILSFLIASVSATLASSPPSATSSANPSSAAGKYPDKNEITKLFNAFSQGNYTVFFSRVAPDVNWTMMGTHPLAGQYHNRTIFIADTLERLKNTLRSSPPATMKLVHVVGGGSEWSVQELHGLGVGKNGLKYDNRFAWVTRWNTAGEIVEVHSYFDSALVQRLITENESGEYTYTDQRDTLQVGPVGANCRA